VPRLRRDRPAALPQLSWGGQGLGAGLSAAGRVNTMVQITYGPEARQLLPHEIKTNERAAAGGHLRPRAALAKWGCARAHLQSSQKVTNNSKAVREPSAWRPPPPPPPPARQGQRSGVEWKAALPARLGCQQRVVIVAAPAPAAGQAGVEDAAQEGKQEECTQRIRDDPAPGARPRQSAAGRCTGPGAGRPLARLGAARGAAG
jgi:hypothetical protein